MEEYVVADKKRQIQIIFAVFASVFIFSVDFSMLNISLPTISRYFGSTLGAAAFLPMAYILVVTSSLLGFGKLGDLRSYKKVFIAGLVTFMIGSILCSMAPNINTLLGFRMFQALGEAMMSPMGIAILTTFLPVRSRGLSLGLVALAQGLGFAAGNIIGGYINTNFVWRGIFLVNIPAIIFTTIFALKSLPAKQRVLDDRRFDVVGAILIFIALSGLVYGLNLLEKLASSAQAILISFAVFAAGFILFFLQEKRIKYPILDFALFRNLNFAYSNIAAFMAVAVIMGCIFIMPFYLEITRGMSVMNAGFLLMIAPLTMLFIAPFSGRLSDLIGSRVICSTGALLEAAAFAVFAFVRGDSHISLISAALFILGVAAGIFMAPNNKLVMSCAPEDKQGVASGVYKIGLSVGGVFGMAIFPIVILQTLTAKLGRANVDMAELKNSPNLLQAGFQNMFIAGVVIAVLAFIFSVLAKDRK